MSEPIQEVGEQMPTILIVDDSPKDLLLLEGLLKKSPYRLVFAADGGQTMEMLAGGLKPDLILLDIVMPGLDGFEVCRQIKQMPDRRDIPIIFITGKRTPQEIVKGFDLGAVDYIVKPFYFAELMARVRTHLALKKALEEKEKLITSLEKALENVKQLSGLLPICANCKKIRDDHGFWKQVEEYIANHTEVQFSHSICPECLVKLYPDLDLK